VKKILLSIVLLVSITSSANAQDDVMPFHVRQYGSFKKILQTNMLEGVVELERALAAPHTYAIGEIKNAEGEITVYNGELWLNYGEDGIDTSINQIPAGEQAMQLVSAQVEKWQEMTIPKNMTENELRDFVLERANKSGLNTKMMFPFLVEGEINDLVWHVLDGADFVKTRQGKQLFFKKLVEYKDHVPAILIGFGSAEIQDAAVFPGELWQVHIIFKNEKTAGHADAFSVLKGSKLRLPIK
jgi:hypothetical protein